MSDSTSHSDSEANRPAEEGPFNLITLRKLVAMMEKHGLTEVSLKNADTHWKLRRGPEAVPGYIMPQMPAQLPPAAPQAAAPPPTAAPPAPAAETGRFIKSPTVGTFYSSASPDDPPFVKVGSRVEPDTVVCLVEAMKVFNQIQAETSGVVAEVLISSGDSVEFGQPLFRLT